METISTLDKSTFEILWQVLSPFHYIIIILINRRYITGKRLVAQKRITNSADQLFQFVGLGSVPLHDASNPDERNDPEDEEEEADAHVDGQRNEDEQRSSLVQNANETNAGQNVAYEKKVKFKSIVKKNWHKKINTNELKLTSKIRYFVH